MENKNISWPGWETGNLIGRGSFGAVYEIHRDVFGDAEKAALKVISIPQNDSDIDEMYSDGYDDESITSTFQSHLKSIVAEYSLMRKMNGSANIVNCDDVRYVQHDDGIGWDIFIKMELLTPLPRALPITVEEDTVIRIAKDICTALELCKKYDIVHRDIKPQNIFVSPNGDYKLGDFGIAKTVEKTTGGTKIGTYKYMAPEVYNNQPYGSGADIYSLGLVLYWLLNERRMPFLPLPPAKLTVAAEDEARNRRFSGEQLPPPAHGSEKLKQIILKACAYDPKERYQSAAELLGAINSMNEAPGPIIIDTPPVVPSKPAEHPKPIDLGEDPKDEKKSNSGRIILAVIAGILILLLLVHSCNGDTPLQPSGTTRPSSSTKETINTTQPTTPPTTEATEPGEMLPIQADWSSWSDSLPDYVTEEDYIIEERTLYSSQTRETTSSTKSSTKDGWVLYDTVQGTGDYGPWSEWSTEEIFSSDSRQVQVKTQYSYQDIWYTQEYSDWSNWSSWGTTPVSQSDTTDVKTRTVYYYYVYKITDNNSSDPIYSDQLQLLVRCRKYADNTPELEYLRSYIVGAELTQGWSRRQVINKLNENPNYSFSLTETTISSINSKLSVEEDVIVDPTTGIVWSPTSTEPYATETQYSYSTRDLQTVEHQGSWSEYSDTEYTASSTRNVWTRTVYRYRDKVEVTTYYFERWSNWSDYSTTAISESDSVKVKEKVQYRYRSKNYDDPSTPSSIEIPLNIVTQPESTSAAEGQKATVAVEAEGAGLTYEWYYRNAGSKYFYLTDSFTENTYSITMNDTRDGRQVFCVITDQYGNRRATDTVTLNKE